jgi:hypothetical protein
MILGSGTITTLSSSQESSINHYDLTKSIESWANGFANRNPWTNSFLLVWIYETRFGTNFLCGKSSWNSIIRFLHRALFECGFLNLECSQCDESNTVYVNINDLSLPQVMSVLTFPKDIWFAFPEIWFSSGPFFPTTESFSNPFRAQY